MSSTHRSLLMTCQWIYAGVARTQCVVVERSTVWQSFYWCMKHAEQVRPTVKPTPRETVHTQCRMRLTICHPDRLMNVSYAIVLVSMGLG